MFLTFRKWSSLVWDLVLCGMHRNFVDLHTFQGISVRPVYVWFSVLLYSCKLMCCIWLWMLIYTCDWYTNGDVSCKDNTDTLKVRITVDLRRQNITLCYSQNCINKMEERSFFLDRTQNDFVTLIDTTGHCRIENKLLFDLCWFCMG